MTEDERKEMWKKWSQMIDNQMAQQIQRQALMQGTWGQSPSPTSVDARGYGYQEPYQDEQGTFYGYKILESCTCGCGQLRSPRYPVEWENGELQADREPSEQSMYGIHFTKRPDHPALNDYYSPYNIYTRIESILVQCALSGTIVETAQGFRAQHAIVTGVFYNGHWTTYQDYQERSAADSRRNPYEERYTWNANYNPNGTAYTSSTTKKRKGGKYWVDNLP